MPPIRRNALLVALVLWPALAHALTIDLAWDYPTPVTVPFTEFRLYRSNSSAPGSFGTPYITGIAPTARAVTDGTVAYATQYCYYVTAATATAESAPSNIACQTTPPEPPAAATNLRATIRP